ncbi:MAG: acyl-CoA dehydrogenase, partial [Deltaproteobacteria bacterium]|nr:acyl-CoA dehydrogenase [Deltaproteobacteria bacterium]
FFVVETDHENYECAKKIETSGVRQAYVAEYALHDYPIKAEDILSKGGLAWDSSLSTVNIDKFELGFASIGMCTHAFYEAINHAANRNLYGQMVTDFPHVKKIFTEAYTRLMAMKLAGLRTADYLRAASETDRRYLLYNPIVKMKVTSQGEKVVALLHEVIAAKGYEQDTYFEMAIREISMLPKLEGTEHVNMALIIKFIENYFFNPVHYPEIPKRNESGNDEYLFRQSVGGLGSIKFPDYGKPYEGVEILNVKVFKEQVELFKEILLKAPPDKTQRASIDYMLATGELFTLIAYAQLILENVKIYDIPDNLINEIFNFAIRDFSNFALNVVLNHENTPEQEEIFMKMIKKPVMDKSGFESVWQNHVYALKDQYVMSE